MSITKAHMFLKTAKLYWILLQKLKHQSDSNIIDLLPVSPKVRVIRNRSRRPKPSRGSHNKNLYQPSKPDLSYHFIYWDPNQNHSPPPLNLSCSVSNLFSSSCAFPNCTIFAFNSLLLFSISGSCSNSFAHLSSASFASRSNPPRT